MAFVDNFQDFIKFHADAAGMTREEYMAVLMSEANKKPGPDPYHRGLEDDEVEDKEDQIKKQADMDDDDPDAYEEMPGDKEAVDKGEVKTSDATKAYNKLYKEHKHVKTMSDFNKSTITEKREDVGKYNTVKKVIKELGRRPSEQELATFINNNYYDVTEVERGEDDPAANDKIADLVAFYKFDIDDWSIAWVDAQNESVVTEAKAYKLKASEFGANTHSAAYNVKGEPTWRVHSTYAIDQVSGDNNPEERDVVFFEAMPINKDIYIKIGGINNLKRSNGSTYGKNFGTTIEEWEKDPKGIAKEASNFLTDADHLKWINKKARSEGQKIKWALKDNYANVIEDLVNKSLELTESVVNEANDMSAKKLSKYAGFKEVEYEGAVYAFTSKELGKMQFQAEPSFKTIDGNLRDDELNLEVDRSMAKTAHAKVLGQIRGYKNIIAFLKGGGAEKYESGSLKEIEKYVRKFNFKSISESKLHESLTVAQKFKALM
jgi:hypothetical protein